MNKSIEQALTSLIPSLSGPLPPELLNLAVSLLAQSRSKASSLKQDEEIARPYACAHIACDRLKQSLNLPSIVPRPPCAPKIYKKVYAYFNSALTVREPRTPRKQRAIDVEANGLTSSPSTRRTPSKSAGTPLKGTPLKRKIGQVNGDDGEELDWIMPLVRHLCKEFKSAALVPHVFVGVSSVLRSEKAQASDPASAAATPISTPSRIRARKLAASSTQEVQGGVISEASIPALIAVIFFYAFTRSSKEDISATQYASMRLKAIKTLQDADAGKPVSEKDMLSDIERLLRRAQTGWLDLEWYQNITSGNETAQTDGLNGIEDEEEAQSDDNRVLSARRSPSKRQRPANPLKQRPGSLQIGLGTMMQEKVDYLSEARRLDFLEWKAGIMARIEQIEREQKENGSPMDIAAG